MPSNQAVDETIRNLQGLAASFAQEVREETAHGPLSPERQLCKEALMTTRVLISKLQLVRSFCQPEPSGLSREQ
jgi:hypothetical protein